ncbi:MAG: CheR family methyltransferase [Polyangiaceae bacterium]
MTSELSPTTFAILAALVEDRLGVHYRPEDKPIFESKLGERLVARGFGSALDYYYALRYDDPEGTEWARLSEALLVGETYFFREMYALDAAMTAIIEPALAAHPGRRARILSAGCSTGEEPLSLAMMADARGIGGRVEIVGADANRDALTRAARGVFRERSMRALPSGYARYFSPAAEPAGAHRIDEAILGRVDFRQVNLLDRARIASLGAFDLVLCRNVLIYFRDDNVVDVARSLARALAKDGRLLVGASESLLCYGTELRCEEREGPSSISLGRARAQDHRPRVLIYRRRLGLRAQSAAGGARGGSSRRGRRVCARRCGRAGAHRRAPP